MSLVVKVTLVEMRLLQNGMPTTVYVRSPVRVTKQHLVNHDNTSLLDVVQGDCDDKEPFIRSVLGHSRLLLLAVDYSSMIHLKTEFARFAKEAGDKQIIDISSQAVSLEWRDPHTQH
ncbi:hypothetical protein BDB00DRAFT_898157 [Zychaea mexicana]|uniref:uncharacterized protein n=1 Tax=Zychaea mexicana TaxID=64656 RepID=UPI0022FE2B7B|nr:uncharacterized protein BDB00DRAFT_898157 [Zychaea mexicana]KAI9499216.1 hypothetical protein BDB00DRAFT_898157 [Zychaea mexicana]